MGCYDPSSSPASGADETPGADDAVWIEGTAQIPGSPSVEVYLSVPRSDWDAMTNEERDDAVSAAADEALDRLGVSFGAETVAASDVPAEWRSPSAPAKRGTR